MFAAPLLAAGVYAQDAWTIVNPPSTQSLRAVCWGGGQFVAVGDNGTIMTSTNGTQWQLRSSGTTESLLAVAYGNGLFVAGGSSGTAITSSDGSTWVLRATGSAQAINGIAYGDGRFVAVGEGTNGLVSANGVSWSRPVISGVTSLRGITYAYGEFVATGDRGDIRISASGSIFTPVTTNRGDYLQAVTYAHHRFVVVGNRGYAYASSDGRTYRMPGNVPRIDSTDLRGITFFNDAFIAVGADATVTTSFDAVNWTRRATPLNGVQLNAVAASPTLAVAVGERGSLCVSTAVERAPTVVLPPENQAVDFDDDLVLTVTAAGTAPLAYQWSHDGKPIAGATDEVLFVDRQDGEHYGEFSVNITNRLGQATGTARVTLSAPRRRNGGSIPRLLDSTFSAEPVLASAPTSAVELPDGRLLVGGGFAVAVNGVTNHGLLALRPDGSVERAAALIAPSLNPGGKVQTLRTAPDGRIFVIGDFTAINGTARHNCARLQADGAFDPTFQTPDAVAIPPTARIHPLTGGGALIAGIDDGKRLYRFNPDGSVDSAFAGQISYNGSIAVIRNAVRDASGGIFVVCTVASQSFLARLLPDGRQDPAYTAYFSFGGDNDVPLLALGDRDRLLYMRVPSNGAGSPVIGSLGSDGLLDSDSHNFGTTIFAIGGIVTPAFRAAAQAPDGRVLMIGWYGNASGRPAQLNRYRSDGKPDDSFLYADSSDGDITGVAPLRDGRILIFGSFTKIGTTSSPHVARLLAYNYILPPPAIIAGNSVTPLTVRSSQPFNLQLRVNATLVSVAWVDEFGQRAALPGIMDGYVLDGPVEIVRSLPGTYYFSGAAFSSNRDTVYGPYLRVDVLDQPEPIILSQPQAKGGFNGDFPAFSVVAAGNGITYQWLKDGTPIAGATSRNYSPLSGEPAIYTVRITNARGSVTSAPAVLTNVAPARITGGPWLSSYVPSPPARSYYPLIVPGQNVEFELNATGSLALSYQWFRDGTALPAATRSTLAFPAVRLADSGDYTVRVSNLAGAETSQVVTMKVTPVPRISNLSIRSSVAAGDALTVGFTVGGGFLSAKPLLLRAVGPTLAGFGVNDALADPQVTLLSGSTTVVANDDWNGDPALAAANAQVGAFAFSEPASKDAALIRSLNPAGYTARITGATNSTGVALAEVYDLTTNDAFVYSTPRLTNVSARANVGTGGNLLIAGFSIFGEVPVKVLIRAIGPGLGSFGVTDALADPKLELFRSGSTAAISSNDNWDAFPNFGEVAVAATSVGAFPLAPSSKDAALVVSLAPGSYTAQVSGVNNASGVSLVEIYELP